MGKWHWFGLVIVIVAVIVGFSVVSAQDQAQPTVKMGSNDQLGSFLVDANGMTLYLFTKDVPGTSSCYDQCAQKWPPLLVADGVTPTLDAGIPGKVGVTERTDGTYQVMYNGWPLYHFASDTAAGDAAGQNVGGVWFVVAPPTVSLGGNADLSDFLVGPNDMTLYMFTKDEMDKSTCYDQCAQQWPPLLVADGVTPTSQPGVPGALGVIDRTDGTYQVTYNHMPLYYFASDTAAGDAAGQNVGGVWFVVKPPTVSVANNADLGDFLVGPNGMTLYTFTKDEPGKSNCYDQCAQQWPPLLVADGETPTAGDGATGTLATAERTDGTYQVTYDGKPLYYWVNDRIPGDTTGQNVGQVWFVQPPTGASAQAAPVAAPTTAATSGSEVVVTIQNFAFNPNPLTIPAGTTVRFVNQDSAAHTVTADDGTFDSGTLNNGQDFTFTFDKAGTFAYYCKFHGGKGGAGMSGTIIVQ